MQQRSGFLIWLASWFRGSQAIREIRRLELRLNYAVKQVKHSEARLNARTHELIREQESLTKNTAINERRLREIGQTTNQDIHESREILRKFEEELASVRSEKKILEEITVPTLVAHHKLILERLDADTAIEVKRRTG